MIYDKLSSNIYSNIKIVEKVKFSYSYKYQTELIIIFKNKYYQVKINLQMRTIHVRLA